MQMASSSNKPGAVHYSMIFFILTTVILSVTTYIFHRDYSDATVETQKAKADLQTANTALSKLDTDLQEVRKTLGMTDQPQVVDLQNPDNPSTVVGTMRLRMRDQGPLAETTFAGTLAKVSEAYKTAISDRDGKVTDLNTRERELLSAQSRYQSQTDDHDKKYRDAEAEKRKVIAERDELLLAKDREIAELRSQNNQVRVELEQEKEARDKDREKAQGEIDKLVAINNKIRDELDEIKKESFEVADGTIRRVDNTSNMVWIDLGDADFLKPRMSFSVYDKNTPGVARTPADIKGKIEVTRIIDAHLAEAKIIDENLYRPMAPGDFIYTPLWSPGRPEKFAVVGAIDLDGDGESDRDLFHKEMAVRGAAIVDEVDDAGNRPTPAINETIKFVIMGALPDPTEAATEDEYKRMDLVLKQAKDMRNEARLYGVRIIPLNAFLDYIGYKPKRRLFRPGDNKPYTIEGSTGSAGSAPDQPAGPASGSYIRSRGTSPGAAKVFNGN
jgi:hypothetical protein